MLSNGLSPVQLACFHAGQLYASASESVEPWVRRIPRVEQLKKGTIARHRLKILRPFSSIESVGGNT